MKKSNFYCCRLCKKCGIATQIENNIDEAIKTWRKAFSKDYSEDYSEYHDVCTGCSGNFGKEEYY